MHQGTAIGALMTVMLGCGGDSATQTYYGETSTDDILNLEEDTGSDGGSGELGDCNEVLTKINGRLANDVNNPTVGDQWVVRMYCDGALLTGANRLFFQPANVAVVDDVSTDAFFVAQGPSKMTMQSGNFIYTKSIAVGAAD